MEDGIAIDDVELRPTQYLESKSCRNGDGTNDRVALIILNSPILEYECFRRLYDHACFRICADGGANRLHDLLINHHEGLNWTEVLRSLPPDLIHGDLDSLQDIVRERYEQIGVEVSHDSDQYSTDFGKCIKQAIEHVPNVRDVLVLGSIGGRVDQGIGLLHELYREQVFRHPSIHFWLFSEASVGTVLSRGTTLLHTPLKDSLITRNIGILPLYGPAIISTNGLKWDVQDWPTEMGGQVSTSNHITADIIAITTDKEVLFTVELAKIG